MKQPAIGVTSSAVLTFQSIWQLEQWLERNHDAERELWIRIFKKNSRVETVTWNDCVVVAIAWGWIDGKRKAGDELSFLQRLTPRRPGSNWSRKNRDHADRLIAEGRMRPSGMLHVNAAKADGRWDNAYSGSADMKLPDDLLLELEKRPLAKRNFELLDRGSIFEIYLRLQTATRLETRKRRMAAILAQLSGVESLHE